MNVDIPKVDLRQEDALIELYTKREKTRSFCSIVIANDSNGEKLKFLHYVG